jgi:hypothetical protein
MPPASAATHRSTSMSARRCERCTPVRGSWLCVAAAAVLLLVAASGCRSAKKPSSDSASHPEHTSLTTGDADATPSASRDASSYREIGERDLFRPLVSAPKPSVGGGGEAGGSSAKAGGGTAAGAAATHPSAPPDPTADLALTGIVETTDGLLVLVESISTKHGEFVGVGEQAFGFTVKSVGPDSVTLARGSQTYELRLGAKEIGGDTTTPAAPAAPATPAAPEASTSPPAGMPNFGGMSSDQRRQAFQNWWNGMSEQDRQRFRDRRGGGGGGFGGGRGGFGGGFGGGRGRRGGG